MNSRNNTMKKDLKALDEMVEEIIVDAYGDDEQLWAFRRWLNIDPFPAREQTPSRRKQQHKAKPDDIDLNKPVELIVLSVKERAVRCRLHGYGLCLWRLGRFDEVLSVINWILWLNPSDNQGVRFLLDGVKEKTAWEDCKDEDTWHLL